MQRARLSENLSTLRSRHRWAVNLVASLLFLAVLVVALSSALRRIHEFGFDFGPREDFNLAVYYPVRAFLDGVNPYDREVYLARYPVSQPFAPYLPGILILHLPFGLLPHQGSGLLYLVVSIALVVAVGYMILRFNEFPVTLTSVLLAAGLIVLSRGGRAELLQGQVTFQIIIAAYVALVYANRVPWVSALGLAIALLKLTYGAPLALLMLALRARTAVILGVFFAGLINLPPLLILAASAGGIRALVGQLVTPARAESFTVSSVANNPLWSPSRVDATALISRLIGEPLSGSAQLLVAAVVLGSAAFALRAIAQREADPPLSVTAGIVCTAVLLSLYHQPHDMPFLALPFAAVVIHRLPEALSRPGVRWTLLILYAFLAANYFSAWGVLDRLGFLDDARALSREPGAILLASLNGLGLLAIFSIYVVVVVWRQQRGSLVPRPRAGVRNRSYSG